MGGGGHRPISANLRLDSFAIGGQKLSTAAPMALLLLFGNTSSESKINRLNCLLFPYQLREKIDLYLSQ